MRQHQLIVQRRARFYSLGEVESARELWIVVHGYGQLAADFISGFASVAGGDRAVVAPEALNRYYREEPGGSHADAKVGATWMTREDREAEIADYVGYLDAVAREVGADGRKLTAVGFSQGVATVTRWTALGTARIDRLILWAGSIPGDLDLKTHADRFPRNALDMVIGSRDEFATWANIDEQRQRLEAVGLLHELHRFEGGHRLDRETLATLSAR